MSKEKPLSKKTFIKRLKQKLAKLAFSPIENTEELITTLKEAQTNNIIDPHTLSIIEKTIQTENLQVRDAMVPFSKMVAIDEETESNVWLKTVINSAHSRFPVISRNDNKIKGILLAKDILNHFVTYNDVDFSFKEYIRSCIIVPESKRLGNLLKEFQREKSHMAVVIDEYGKISGLITIEDILEQIVGEIEDEHDLEEDNIINHGKGRYLIRATTEIKEFNEYFKVKLNIKDNDIDTIAGFVISEFARLPKQFEKIKSQGFKFKILRTDSKRIFLIEVKKSKNK